MKSIRLIYKLENEFEFVFAEHGDLVTLKVDGEDRSEDGDAIEDALSAVYKHYDLQKDIADSFMGLA